MKNKTELSFSDLHKIAIKVIKNIHRQDSVEHGRSIDKFGNIEKYVGGVDWVLIDINQDTRITLHNHPNEYKIPESFSKYDIYNFLSKKYLYEIIVCGYDYYFYLRRESFNGVAMDVCDEVSRLRDRVKQNVMKKYLSDDNNDSKTPKRRVKEMNVLAEKEYHNKLSELLSTKGLSYGKVKI